MSNIQKLGDVLAGRMKKTANAAVPTFLELGTIGEGLTLTTDSIKTPIAPSSYMVALDLTHENYYSYNELNSSKGSVHIHSGGGHSQYRGTGVHTHNGSEALHDHRVPSVFRRLQVGDRVLVAWAGVEPVIISVVVAGTTISTN